MPRTMMEMLMDLPPSDGSICTHADPTSTLKDIDVLKRMLDADRQLQSISEDVARGVLVQGFGGFTIHESPLCEAPVPMRKHKRGPGQSLAYHLRVQKKWAKRYGMTTEQWVVAVDGRELFMSPHTMARLRAGL